MPPFRHTKTRCLSGSAWHKPGVEKRSVSPAGGGVLGRLPPLISTPHDHALECHPGCSTPSAARPWSSSSRSQGLVGGLQARRLHTRRRRPRRAEDRHVIIFEDTMERIAAIICGRRCLDLGEVSPCGVASFPGLKSLLTSSCRVSPESLWVMSSPWARCRRTWRSLHPHRGRRSTLVCLQCHVMNGLHGSRSRRGWVVDLLTGVEGHGEAQVLQPCKFPG